MKRGINLLYQDRHTGETLFTLLVFALFMGFLVFFSRHFVAEPLRRADRAEAAYHARERELEKLREDNSVYAQVRAEYSHYGNGYLNEAERARQDRITMLNVIDARIGGDGDVQRISITDNVASITMRLPDGERLPEILGRLEESEYVSYVTASTAATVNQDRLGTENAWQDRDSEVTAEITVSFRTEEEVRAAVAAGTPSYDAALDAALQANGENAYVPELRESRAASAPSEAENRTDNAGSTGDPDRAAGQRAARVPETAAAAPEGQRGRESTAESAPKPTETPSPTQTPIPTKSANVQTPSEESTEITSLNNGYNPR